MSERGGEKKKINKLLGLKEGKERQQGTVRIMEKGTRERERENEKLIEGYRKRKREREKNMGYRREKERG